MQKTVLSPLLQVIARDPDNPGEFIVKINHSHVQPGQDVRWLPQGTAVTIIFPANSPFPGVQLNIGDLQQGQQTISLNDAGWGSFSYLIICHESGKAAEGDDGNDPTLIID